MRLGAPSFQRGDHLIVLTETDAEDTFGAHGEVAAEYVRLIVGWIAGLDPNPQLVLPGHDPDLLRLLFTSCSKYPELLLCRWLEFSTEDRLIVNPNRNFTRLGSALYLD